MFVDKYATARDKAGFRWYAYATYYTLLDITGISMKEFNTGITAGIELFKGRNREKVREIFGEGVGLPAVSTPGISYGHVNGLGLELIFPEGGEVGYSHEVKTLDEYIGILARDVDFAKEGMAPFYMEYRDKLKEAYPEENDGYNYGSEGPVTTAYELRGMDVFYDPYDQPEKYRKFLALLTDSIVKFNGFRSSVNGQPCFSSRGAGLCDDVAAMFAPSMWEEFILPYWEQYYSGLTDGERRVHCEDLTAAHMPLLEKAGLDVYDPGISPKLNPEIICAGTRVPFEWRLGSFHLKRMETDEVEKLVYKAAGNGASCVFTVIEAGMTDDATAGKIRRFVRACRKVESMLENGVDRKQIGSW